MVERFYSQSRAARPPLKIGVLLNTHMIIGPLAEVLRQICESNFAVLKLAVFNAEAAPKPNPSPRPGFATRVLRVLRDSRRRKGVLFDYYERWDRRRHPEAARLLQEVDTSSLLAGAEQLQVMPLKKGFVHRFPPDAIAAIRTKDLDLLLLFGFNIVRGEILTCARYGIWSYHHDDNDYYRGGPACFWELYEENPLSGVMLQVLTEELDGGRVLVKALTATQPGISLVQNRVRPYATGIPFVLQKLYELHQFGWEHVELRMPAPAPYQGRRSLYRKPTNAEVGHFLLSRLTRKAWRRIRRRPESVYHWRIALRCDPRRRIDPMHPSDLNGFQWMHAPVGHFYADPCLFSRQGRTWLFFEDYLYNEERGVICCAELHPDGSLSEPSRVLDLPCHSSYPFVFEDAGEIFMIPETKQDGTVKLFRATDFPLSWQLEKTLFTGQAVDTTLWRQDELYWFFTSVQDRPGASHVLLLFSSDTLTGEWKFHPANPISTDIRTARPAGALFRHCGKLIRTSQDGSVRYGYALGFHEIVTLNPRDYRERSLARIEPSWSEGLTGCHTYSRCDTAEALDGSTPLPLSIARDGA